MNCDIDIPTFVQTECRETRNLVESIRVHKRIPRKLKKKLKRLRGGRMSGVQVLINLDNIQMVAAPIGVVEMNYGGVYQFKHFNHERT